MTNKIKYVSIYYNGISSKININDLKINKKAILRATEESLGLQKDELMNFDVDFNDDCAVVRPISLFVS